jgi:hypothetical protein
MHSLSASQRMASFIVHDVSTASRQQKGVTCTRLQILEMREIQPLQQYNSPPKYIGDTAPTEGEKGGGCETNREKG